MAKFTMPQPTSRALRPGTSDKSGKTSDKPFDLGTIKGPKSPSMPKGPTQIGKGVGMPPMPKLAAPKAPKAPKPFKGF